MRRLALLIIVAAVLCAGVAPAGNAQSGLTPKAIEQISQSVVFILEYVNGEPVSTGSGTIVEPTGLIYTNRHVVEAGGDFEIYQTTTLGELPTVIGWATVVQAFNEIDFAILQIDRAPDGSPINPTSLNLPVINEAAGEVALGDSVYVFGYPSVGDGYLVVTQGSITSVENANLFDRRVPLWYRTDAEISPGNSGGLVVDINGRFLGLPTMVRSEERTLGRLGGILPFVAVETVLGAYAQGLIPDTVTVTLDNTSSTEICYIYIAPSNAADWGPDRLGDTGTVPPGATFTIDIEPGIYDMLLQDCSATALANLRERDFTASSHVRYPADETQQTANQSLSIKITNIEYDVAANDTGDLGFKIHTEIQAVGYRDQEIRVAVFYLNNDGSAIPCENMTEDECDPAGGLTVQSVLTPSFDDTIWDDYWFWIPYIGLPDSFTGTVNFQVVANVGPNDGTTLSNPSSPSPVTISLGSGGPTPTSNSEFSITITRMEFDVGGDRSSEEGIKTYVDFEATGYRGVPVRVALFFFWADGTPIPCGSDSYYCDPGGGLTVQEVVTPTYDSSAWTDYWMHVPYSQLPRGLSGTQRAYVVANIGPDGSGTLNNPSGGFNFELYY